MTRVSIWSGILLAVVLASASAAPLALSWRYPTGGQIRSSPVVGSHGTVFALSDDGFVYAFTPEGRAEWSCNLGGLVTDSLSVGSDGTVYAGKMDGTVVAINPRGQIIWRFATEGELLGSPAIANDGTIFVSTVGGRLYSVSLSGSLEWKITLPARMTEQPVLDNRETLYLGGADRRLYALTRWGSFKWSLPLPGVPRDAAVGSDGTIYLLTTAGSRNDVVCVSPEGAVKWATTAPADSFGVLLGEKRIFVASRTGEVLAVDPMGTVDWKHSVGKTVSGAWLISSKGLALMGTDRVLSVLEPVSGALESRQKMDAVGGLGIGNGELLVGGQDWVVYAYGPMQTDPQAQWAQGSADARHSGRASGAHNDAQVKADLVSVPEYMALSLELNPTSRGSLMQFLNETAQRVDAGTLGKSTWYVRGLVERALSVGVLNPILEGNSVVNDFPAVRARAAELLGRLASLDARTALIRVLVQEDDAFAASKEILALGEIGSDHDGQATDAIAAAVRRFSGRGGAEASRVAFSAIRAIESIAHYEGAVATAAGGVTLLAIYRGDYPSDVRQAALDALRNHSP